MSIDSHDDALDQSSHELPVLCFGTSESGYGLLGSLNDVAESAKESFLEFAKSISWKPKKLDYPDLRFLALVPCPDGVFICRISEAVEESYGRSLPIYIEGILCSNGLSCWERFLDLKQWPEDVFPKSTTMSLSLSKSTSEYTSGLSEKLPPEWSLESNVPVIFCSENILNLPESWVKRWVRTSLPDKEISGKSEKLTSGEKKSNKEVVSCGNIPAAEKNSLGTTSKKKMLIVYLSVGLIVGFFGGYNTPKNSDVLRISELENSLQQWRNTSMRHLSAETPDSLEQSLYDLISENHDLRKVEQACTSIIRARR